MIKKYFQKTGHFVIPLPIAEEDHVVAGDANHLVEVSNDIIQKRFLLVMIL